MEILPSLLGYISSRVKVLKQNVSDLATDTGNALEKTASNTAETIKDTIADPMSFTGAGTLIGKGAKLFSFKEADRAAKLQGHIKDTNVITRETGTWLGHPDGKPRQEISDAPAKIDPNQLLTDMNAERYLSTEPVRYSKDTAKLHEILQHPSLFANYPELKDINVIYGHGVKNSTGYFDPRTNTILAAGRTPEEAKSIIIHEIQHAVQRRDGWSPGASLENIPYDSRTKQQYEQKVMDLKRNKNIDWAATDKLKELDYKMRRELYMRTAGEADARAAQARQYLTAEELRQFPINQNFYDIPLKEMLIGKP